jgi:hypothetical protein
MRQAIHRLRSQFERLRRRLNPHSERTLLLDGRCMAWQAARLPASSDLRAIGFGVFSQHDEDGIIQFLISHAAIEHRTFIEFGVENYEESNTRFLLVNNNWQGMVLDSSPENIRHIRRDRISRRHDLEAHCAFITRDNINWLLAGSGFADHLGLLSIDIDGNDYWVWEAIEARPAIVVCEYNSLFGLEPLSIPYQADFERTRAHYSNLYYGCSLGALAHLAEQKGYILVGSNQRGNNAFFVRKDAANGLSALSAAEAYVNSRFRESRNPRGHLSYLRGEERRALIAHLPLVNVITGETVTLSRDSPVGRG